MKVSEQLGTIRPSDQLDDLKSPQLSLDQYFQRRLQAVLENVTSEFNNELLRLVKSELSDFKKTVEEIDYKSSVKKILAALDSHQKHIQVVNLASQITSFYRENMYYVNANTGQRLLETDGDDSPSTKNLYNNVARFYAELHKLPEFAGYVAKLQTASNAGRGAGLLKKVQDHIERHIEGVLFKELNDFLNIAENIYNGYSNGFILLKSGNADELKRVIGDIKKIHSLPVSLRLAFYSSKGDLYTDLNDSKYHMQNLLSRCVDEKDLEISNLSAELTKKKIKELEHIKELTEASFRSSVEARLFKLLKEVTSEQPDKSRIEKLVKQLNQTETEKINCILSEFQLHTNIDQSAFRTINRLLSVSSEEQYDIQAVENIQEPYTAREDKNGHLDAAPASDLQIQEDQELLRMLIEDLGVADEESINNLLVKCSIDQLDTISLQVAEGNKNLLKLLISNKPDLIDPTNEAPFSYYISRLDDALEICRGLEEYEVFNPYTHPEHFCDIEIMARTVKAAKMLKEVLHGLDIDNNNQPVFEEQLTQDNYLLSGEIDKLGINGRLCVAVVMHGFWFEGSLAVAPKVCKAEYIRRNLPHQFYSINSKVMGKVLRALVDNNVVIQVDKKRVNSAFSLQPNTSKVPEGAFRELLTMVLEQRRS